MTRAEAYAAVVKVVRDMRAGECTRTDAECRIMDVLDNYAEWVRDLATLDRA